MRVGAREKEGAGRSTSVVSLGRLVRLDLELRRVASLPQLPPSMRSDAATEAAFCLPPDGGSTSVDDDAAAGCARLEDAAGAASPTFSGEAGGVGSFADGLDLRSRARRGEPRFGELREGGGRSRSLLN